MISKEKRTSILYSLLHCCSVLRCTSMQMASPFQIRFLEMKRIIKQLRGADQDFL